MPFNRPFCVYHRSALCCLLACSSLKQLSPSYAAQLGEELNPPVMFDSRPCVRRTALGACAEQGGSAGTSTTAPGSRRVVESSPAKEIEPESDLIRELRQRSAANAAINEELVREKTRANGLPGGFGPFSSSTAVMGNDGSMVVLKRGRYENLKDKGKIYKSASGLEKFVDGFDPAAPEPARQKFLGLF